MLPFLLAMELVFLLVRDTGWIGVWPMASATSQIAAAFVAPAMAAAAAWSAGRLRRSGADHPRVRRIQACRALRRLAGSRAEAYRVYQLPSDQVAWANERISPVEAPCDA